MSEHSTLEDLDAEIADLEKSISSLVVVDKYDVPPNLIPLECASITPEMLPLIKLTKDEIDRISAQMPGGVKNIQDIYPLAPLQEGILFHHMMEEKGDVYVIITQKSFDTKERLESYLKAYQFVVDRHDILRTAILWKDFSQPIQVVLRKASLKIETVNADQESSDDVASQLRTRFNPRQFRINLEEAPMVRAFIAEDKKNNQWILTFLNHHIAIDHLAWEIIATEMNAFLSGNVKSLMPPLPYRNFVAQAIFGVDRQEQEDFFRKMLGDVEEPTVPFGLTDTRGDGSEIKQVLVMLDGSVTNRMLKITRQLGISTASLCHVAYAKMLSAVSGQKNVVFGTVLLGRSQGFEGTERMMGLFINTLPIRINIGESSVESTVKSAHSLLGDLLKYENASLAMAQKCSQIASPTPLFTAMLNYRHNRMTKEGLEERKAAQQGIMGLFVEERNNYPFSIAVEDCGDRFGFTAKIHKSIDATRVCEYMANSVTKIVEALETAPETEMRRISVVPEKEYQQLKIYAGKTVQFEPAGSFHEYFERQVDRTPDAFALEFEGAVLTYKTLDEKANQLAAYLKKHGVGRDVFVGIMMDRSLEMFIGILGILKAGGAYVPLDTEFPAERLAFILNDIEAPVVLTQEHHEDRLKSVFAARFEGSLVKNFEILAIDRDWNKSVSAYSNKRPEQVNQPQDLAYLIYTSGSTGKPKGCQNTHIGISNFINQARAQFPINSSNKMLFQIPYTFDMSVPQAFWPLFSGASLVIAKPGGHKDPGYLIDLIALKKVTHSIFVPSMLQVFLEDQEVQACATLCFTIVGGESLTQELVNRYYARLPHAKIVNMYGPAETGCTSTFWECEKNVQLNSIPIGFSNPNNKLYILDELRNIVPIGVWGELFIGGVQVGRGYLKRPDLTKERFVKDPFSVIPNAIMYQTGDRARFLENGAVEFQGRVDFQIKVRGFRVEPGEIEAILLSNDKISQVTVVAKRLHGESNPLSLVAYIVNNEKFKAQPPSQEELKEFLSSRLPEYMVPSVFVSLEAMPTNASGKADRSLLMKRHDDVSLQDEGYEAPIDNLEISIAKAWEDVLKVSRVGRMDKFFGLGGDSLSLIRVHHQLRALGFGIELKDLFENDTVLAIAELVRAKQEAQNKRPKSELALGGLIEKMESDFKDLKGDEILALLEAEEQNKKK